MPAIFGYTLLNDISARDVQFKDSQITSARTSTASRRSAPASSPRTRCPTRTAVALKTRLNGAHACRTATPRTGSFRCRELIAFLSQRHAAGARRHRHHRHAGRRRLLPQAAGLHAGRATWSRSRPRASACCERRSSRLTHGARRPASAWSAAASTPRTTSMPGATSRPTARELAAVCDRRPGQGRARRADVRRAAYTDVATMLDRRAARRGRHRDPACDTHRALVRDCDRRRASATIVQKPLAPTWEDCVAIVEAAATAGVWLRGAREFPLPDPDAAGARR